ncbi:MAG TPA: polyphosphate kinase 1 [Pirellulales bacterium]|nr:polyphosphate kinase 1 [Pirellulales bacterium]
MRCGDDLRAEFLTTETTVYEQTFPPDLFINRELSWLDFNARVLEEAEDPRTPLLERVKFLAIFSSNLDEFFMVRVAGLREQAFGDGAPQDYSPDGLRAIAQLQRITKRTQELVAAQYRCWNEAVRPALNQEGIRLLTPAELNGEQQAALDRFFRERAWPILTPMAIDPAHPSPRYHNRGLYLAAMLERRRGLGPKQLFAVVQVPQVLPRLVPLGVGDDAQFILLEDLVSTRLPELFGGFDVLSWTTFRITRDSDIDLLEQESDDMLRLIEDRLKTRQRGEAVRLEVSAGGSEELSRMIIDEEAIRDNSPEGYSEVYRIPGPLDLSAMMELLKLADREQLRDPPFSPQMPRSLRRRDDLFATIARRDILLHHPYDSFDAVVDFVTKAANDPKVLAIKQTLYRTSGDSPITRALIQAADNGKHVTALVELKARFDEANNVSWARQLERAGVHVVFGFLDWKTHCKLSLVVRQEGNALKRYVHLGTGNYNQITALTYTDLGLFTADEDIATDASALFNLLTGYSQGHQWRKLVVAPTDLHRRTLQLIEEQIQRAQEGKPSRIFAKINAIVDHRVIESLYRASQAGVPVDIVDRGICCLRPGVPGTSDSIRVRSIVDRFLEHSRIYVFGPDAEAKVFLSSADWMPRNFYRRVEVMFPIEQEDLRDRILHEIIPAYLMDNVKARILQSDGTYIRRPLAEGETPYRVQERLLGLPPASAAASDIRLAATLDSNGSAAESAMTEGQAIVGLQGADGNGLAGSGGLESNGLEGNGSAGNGAPYSENAEIQPGSFSQNN